VIEIIHNGDFIDKSRAIKSSHEEKSDSSMKRKDARMFKHIERMWVTSFSSFIILTTKLDVLGVNTVSCKL
jgi:hypothetical protein